MSEIQLHSKEINLPLIMECLQASFSERADYTHPYPYFVVKNLLPDPALPLLRDLPYEAPNLEGPSGKRDLHNATRNYFDRPNQDAHEIIRLISEAFQSSQTVRAIEQAFNADLAGTYLRIEYAQDTDGFWLEPHSDLGVKRFTLLFYLSDDPRHLGLGTDIYDDRKTYLTRVPFIPNSAMIFVPSDITLHGFEPRPIAGVRKSLIVNYVTEDWRAREQLAFPDRPVPS